MEHILPIKTTDEAIRAFRMLNCGIYVGDIKVLKPKYLYTNGWSMLLITIIGSILFEMDLLQQIMIRSGTALFCFLLYRNYFNITNTI